MGAERVWGAGSMFERFSRNRGPRQLVTPTCAHAAAAPACQALELNDAAQRSLDRYADMVAAADGRRPRPPPRKKPAAATEAAPALAAAAAPAAVADSGAGKAAAGAAATAAAIPDLLSLDDWSPHPALAAEANGAGPSAAALGSQEPLAAAPVAVRKPPSVTELAAGNNPFAQPFGTTPPPAAAAHPPVTAEAVSPPPTAAAAPAPAPAAAPNPFLNDAAFAAISPSLAFAAAAPPPEHTSSSGNPFASPGQAAGGPMRTASFAGEAGGTPAAAMLPPLAIPGGGSGYPVLGPTSVSPGSGAAAAGGGFYAPPPVSPGFGTAQPTPAYLRPLNDAFTDLVRLAGAAVG